MATPWEEMITALTARNDALQTSLADSLNNSEEKHKKYEEQVEVISRSAALKEKE